jgi:hypothetical protein
MKTTLELLDGEGARRNGRITYRIQEGGGIGSMAVVRCGQGVQQKIDNAAGDHF